VAVSPGKISVSSNPPPTGFTGKPEHTSSVTRPPRQAE